MGWTYSHAIYWNGDKVDIKKECENMLNWDGHLKVEKLQGYGSTIYAAIRDLKTDEIFGAVVTTHCINDPFEPWNFGYNAYHESVGPCSYDCPDSILNLLTPTEDESANKWRNRCRLRNQNKKLLKKAKPGSRIVVFWENVLGGKYSNQEYKLQQYGKRKLWCNINNNTYVTSPTILDVGFVFVE